MNKVLVSIVLLSSTACHRMEVGLPPSRDEASIYVINLQSADKAISSSAARKLFSLGEPAIPELITVLGLKAKCNGNFHQDGPGVLHLLSEPSEAITVGIVSLYLICAIYENDFNFSQSLRLIDRHNRVGYMNHVWYDKCAQEVIKWEGRRKLLGIKKLRELGDAPLSRTTFRFY